jgi:acetyl esterase/lipase
MRVLFLCLFLSSAVPLAFTAAEEIRLWPLGAPGSEGKTTPEIVDKGNISNIHFPSITVYPADPAKKTDAAILIIPGGGHSKLCVGHEGYTACAYFAAHGITAFLLKHRLAREKDSPYTIMDHAVPDTQRAMRLIRSRAAEWGIDVNKVGALGFSAGGELVAQIAMKLGQGDPSASDVIDRINATPAFQGLIYPGRSGDIIPTGKDAPPAFLCAGINDRPDISEGLAEVYLRYKRAGAVAELHIYAGIGHGFGLRPNVPSTASGWPDRFMEWLRGIKIIP